MVKRRVEDMKYSDRELQLVFMLCNEIVTKCYEYPNIENETLRCIISEITYREFGFPMINP